MDIYFKFKRLYVVYVGNNLSRQLAAIATKLIFISLMIIIAALQFYVAGSNTDGQLGVGSKKDVKNYTCVNSFQNNKLTSLRIGMFTTLAVDAAGAVWGWGSNDNGRLGNEDLRNDILTPQKIQWFADNGIKAVQAETGFRHSAVLGADGRSVYTFGLKQNSVLGRIVDKAANPIPGLVDLQNLQESEKIVKLFLFKEINYILTNFGNYYAWGYCYPFLCPGHEYDEKIEVPTLMNFPFKFKEFVLGPSAIWIKNDMNKWYSVGWNEYG